METVQAHASSTPQKVILVAYKKDTRTKTADLLVGPELYKKLQKIQTIRFDWGQSCTVDTRPIIPGAPSVNYLGTGKSTAAPLP